MRAIKPFQINVGEVVIVKDSNPIRYRFLESAYNKDSHKISLVDENGNLINTKKGTNLLLFS